MLKTRFAMFKTKPGLNVTTLFTCIGFFCEIFRRKHQNYWKLIKVDFETRQNFSSNWWLETSNLAQQKMPFFQFFCAETKKLSNKIRKFHILQWLHEIVWTYLFYFKLRWLKSKPWRAKLADGLAGRLTWGTISEPWVPSRLILHMALIENRTCLS